MRDMIPRIPHIKLLGCHFASFSTPSPTSLPPRPVIKCDMDKQYVRVSMPSILMTYTARLIFYFLESFHPNGRKGLHPCRRLDH
jgi:hypothetical protein